MIRPSVRRAGAAVLTLAAAACAASVSQVEVPLVYDLDHDPAADIAEVDPDRGEVVPADELRVLLRQQLSRHGVTLVQSMQTVGVGDAEGSAAWIDAMVDNTGEITEAIGLVYGPTAAAAFNQQWAQHTQFLVDFAAAEHAGDDAGADEALAQLEAYARDSGSFLEFATDQRLPADLVEEMLVEHVEHMVEQLRAHRAGDHDRALELAIDDHDHLLAIGDALAGAIADQHTGAFPGDIATGPGQRRSAATASVGGLVHAELTHGDDTVEPWYRDVLDVADGDPDVRTLLDEFRSGTSVDARATVEATAELPRAVDTLLADTD
ncbi:MAG: hypothetical protein WD225_03880 [Ilumatobacteraceae bacterium]